MNNKQIARKVLLIALVIVGIGAGFAAAAINNEMVKGDESKKLDMVSFGVGNAVVMAVTYAIVFVMTYVNKA